MASRTKTGLVETTPTKITPASPRVSKLVRSTTKSESSNNSFSPLHASRPSPDRFSHSANSKPTVDKRSPKSTLPGERPHSRAGNGADMQAQLTLALEDVKKVNDQIATLEREKGELAEELKHAQKAAEEANGKLEEAFLAQRKAQEDSEIEIFRAMELEQAGIEEARSKEEEWRREIEAIKRQHAIDFSSLHTTTEELHKVKQDLAMVTDAKHKALDHADSATRIAELHATKNDQLSADLEKYKALLAEKLENDAVASNEMSVKLHEEIESLKEKLAKAKVVEEAFEKSSVELEALKTSELLAQKKVKELEMKSEEIEKDFITTKESHLSVTESLESAVKQIEEHKALLHKGDTEIATLKEQLATLELTLDHKTKILEDSDKQNMSMKDENSTIVKEMERFKADMEILKEEHAHAVENAKISANDSQILTDEKEKLAKELEISRSQEEKFKKAIESFEMALQLASKEARASKEEHLSSILEKEKQIEELKLSLKTTTDNFDVANNKASDIKISLEESKMEGEKLTQQVLNQADELKKCKEINDSLHKEVERLVKLLKQTEGELCAIKEEEGLLNKELNEVKCEVFSSKEAIEEMKKENSKLKESLLEKETEMGNIMQEKEEIIMREALALKKVEELTKRLEETKTEEFGEKEFTLLPKVAHLEDPKGEDEEGDKKDEKDCVEVEVKMWESCQVEKEEEEECLADVNGNVENEKDTVGGISLGNSDEVQSGIKKKKSSLLRRIGSMLKKGSK